MELFGIIVTVIMFALFLAAWLIPQMDRGEQE